MASERLFHVGVKALIQDDRGQILLMHEDVSTHSLPTTQYWDFPGGRIQEGETIVDALKREVEEETGVKKFLGEPEFQAATVSNHHIKLKNGEVVGLVLLVYKVAIDPNSQIRLSHEHLGYEWVDLAEAKRRLAHKYPQEFIDRL